MKKFQINSILFRYCLLLILGLGNLFIIYLILAPLTIYPVFFILSQFNNAFLLPGVDTEVCSTALNYFPFLQKLACLKTTIRFDYYYVNIIPACIAGSAYYLLLILSLSTQIEAKKRIKSILFILGAFLLVNIIRILLFTVFFTRDYKIFDTAHLASWYFTSTALVIIIWFTNVYLFNIKSIPIYSDIKEIINQIKNKK